ncbi:hypothetical protein [Novosphingobium album (ex Liu et al. 2023)]|uniref:DUF2778 domain-containing protein n=1 Tax=Novosphingobium album (ex Liu et al. 2023) TaxID=3031130 RepID=A0ABT5WUZ6_9SPHN|nr:hypothetical protein [Novosphingobium album (ex Liu et al. 2023)]MDE8653696.1 hypothetical protein [Novosphingobium album (ex Liu et al. 2023)]
MDDMTFNSLEGTLYGTVGGTRFHMRAVSGGRGGSRQKNAAVDILANNFLSSAVKKGPNPIGGTIPMGSYDMEVHETKQNQIRLIPVGGQRMFGRDGFLIHGQGPRGSDGCIVPYDFGQLQTLYKKVKALNESGVKPLLSVIVTGDVEHLLEKVKRYNNTA